MLVVIIFNIISFFLQGIISNYLNYTISNPSLLSTIYTIITIIIVSKYFDDERKYYFLAFILGLLYDLVYTNTFVLNAILFFTIALIARYFTNLLSDNIISVNIISLASIFIYHILSFIILGIISYNTYNIKLLLIICTHSIIMTLIYTTIMYLLSNYISTKIEIKLIR